jgi:transketolase
MTAVALDAAAALAEGGLECRVIDMYSVKPVDREAVIAAARDTGAIVTAEEHLVRGGLGAAVAQVVVEEHPVPMRFVGVPETYMGSGSVEELMERHGFSAAHVENAVREAVAAKGGVS